MTTKSNKKTKNSSNKNCHRDLIAKSVQQLCGSIDKERPFCTDGMMQMMQQQLHMYQQQKQTIQLNQVHTRMDKMEKLLKKAVKK